MAKCFFDPAPNEPEHHTHDPIKNGRYWHAYGAGEANPRTVADLTGLYGWDNFAKDVKAVFKCVTDAIDHLLDRGTLPGANENSGAYRGTKLAKPLLELVGPVDVVVDVIDYGYGSYARAYENRVARTDSWIGGRPDDPWAQSLGPGFGYPKWETPPGDVYDYIFPRE